VTKNTFIENIPNNYFNYWKIMSFNLDIKKFKQISSSKDYETFIPLQKEEESSSSFSVTINKHHLFHLDDFDVFHEAIKNDIKFLKSISSYNFCLTLLYYEFENKNMNKNSLFIEQKTKFDLPSSLKSNNLKNFSEENRKNKNLILSFPNNSSSQKRHGTININETNEDITENEIKINIDMKKITDNISVIPDNSNISRSMIIQNGFDVSYNNYRGLIYFRWDNIFYQKKCTCCGNFYDNYINNVMRYFSK
jgi:hypothetical protein